MQQWTALLPPARPSCTAPCLHAHLLQARWWALRSTPSWCRRWALPACCCSAATAAVQPGCPLLCCRAGTLQAAAAAGTCALLHGNVPHVSLTAAWHSVQQVPAFPRPPLWRIPPSSAHLPALLASPRQQPNALANAHACLPLLLRCSPSTASLVVGAVVVAVVKARPHCQGRGAPAAATIPPMTTANDTNGYLACIAAAVSPRGRPCRALVPAPPG